jgi:hypothetical protein
MATFDVLVWKITTSYTGTWNTNLGPVTLAFDNYLHVRLNDVAQTLSVDYTSAEAEGGGSYMGTLTEGPNLFFGFGGAAELRTVQPYYQFCDGTTLMKVGSGSLYPYGTLSANAGAAECVIAPVCDLDISPFYTTTDATGPVNPDGELVVSATSSNGTIKFSFDPNFDYTTQGQTSGTFSGLISGVYTVYAKDAIGCQDNITIEVLVTTVYNVKYRLEFTDSLKESSKHHRVDILERAYVGAVTEFCSGGDPLHVRWNGDSNDPNKTLIPAELNLVILKEVFGTFTDLFTDDDRKYKVIYYIDSTSAFISPLTYFIGYVVPEFHNEPWIFEPYELTITATDQLGELKNEAFIDENDNKIKGEQKAIKLIAAVLKKPDLGLNIRCAINMFSAEMDSAISDDPLDQAYIDTRIFLDDKDSPIDCEDVIDKILAPFRAQLCQSMGYWWIRRLSDTIGNFAYREFDVEGDYVDNDTFNPVQGLKFPSQTNRAAWANRSAMLSHLRNYGYFAITHDAGRDNNLIDEGRFEEDDIMELSSGNQFFKNWSFFVAQPGVKFGFEHVINGSSKGAFFADFEMANNAQAFNKLYSVEVPLGELGGLSKIQFQYFVEPRFSGLPYITLGWSAKVTDGTSTSVYMRTDHPPYFSRVNNTDEIINEIYVTSFNTWNTFELTSQFLLVAPPATLQITFYMHNHYGRDFDDIVDLKNFIISDLDDVLREGKKVMVAEDNLMYVYTSVADAVTAESLPDVVRPNSYANDYLWMLDKIVNIAPNLGLVKKFLIDNVSFSFYPAVVIGIKNVFIEPPATFTYDEELSTFIKSNFIKTMYLGDMPRFSDEYEGNERLIYRGYFRMEDGTPTTLWTRTGVTEEKPLLQITLEDFRDQFRNPSRKLSGSFISDIVFNYINSVQEDFEGSRYQFLTFDFDAKKAMYTIDMVATATGDGGEPPVSNGAFSNAYSDAFDNV